VGQTLALDTHTPLGWSSPTLHWGSVDQPGGSMGLTVLRDGVYRLSARVDLSIFPADAVLQLEDVRADWTFTVLAAVPVSGPTVEVTVAATLTANAWVMAGFQTGPSSAAVMSGGQFSVVQP
jgi:hypothetical protein